MTFNRSTADVAFNLQVDKLVIKPGPHLIMASVHNGSTASVPFRTLDSQF